MASRRAAGPSFTAIDFETANRYRNSACAVGLVQVLSENVAIVTRRGRQPAQELEQPQEREAPDSVETA